MRCLQGLYSLAIHRDTQSVTESVLNYRVENGRTYHAYKDGGKFRKTNLLGSYDVYHSF